MKRLIIAILCGLAYSNLSSLSPACADVGTATEKSFQADVLDSKDPVFVDFYAPWCGPCKKMDPIVVELSKEFDGKMKFVKIDVDDNGKLAEQFNIESIPTFIIYQKGKEVDRKAGLAEKADLTKKVEALLTTENKEVLGKQSPPTEAAPGVIKQSPPTEAAPGAVKP
jgi:thioredoxin 1